MEHLLGNNPNLISACEGDYMIMDEDFVTENGTKTGRGRQNDGSEENACFGKAHFMSDYRVPIKELCCAYCCTNGKHNKPSRDMEVLNQEVEKQNGQGGENPPPARGA